MTADLKFKESKHSQNGSKNAESRQGKSLRLLTHKASHTNVIEAGFTTNQLARAGAVINILIKQLPTDGPTTQKKELVVESRARDCKR